MSFVLQRHLGSSCVLQISNEPKHTEVQFSGCQLEQIELPQIKYLRLLLQIQLIL